MSDHDIRQHLIDGNGAGVSNTFAQLNTGLGMTAARFVVT